MTKNQNIALRKQRTRQLIQLGGLVQKSGLLEMLDIQDGEDLQDYNHLHKSAKVLGFLLESLEQTNLDFEHWEQIGERQLKYKSDASSRV